MRAGFVLAIVFAVLAFCPAQAARAAETEPAPRAEPEARRCTMPSAKLLMPNDAGTSSGTLTSIKAGISVYFKGLGNYVKCLTAKTNAAFQAMGDMLVRWKLKASALLQNTGARKPAAEPEDPGS